MMSFWMREACRGWSRRWGGCERGVEWNKLWWRSGGAVGNGRDKEKMLGANQGAKLRDTPVGVGS